MPAHAGCGDPENGLALWWKFDDGSGTSAADSSGNGDTGTIEDHGGPPVWGTGIHGGAMLYSTGADGSVGADTSPANLNITGSITLSAWINLSSINAGDIDDVVINKGLTSPDQAYQLKGSQDCTGVSGNDNLVMLISPDGSNLAERCSNTVLQINRWYFIAGVYNASAQTMDVYVNGVIDDGSWDYAGPPAPPAPSSIHNSSHNLEVGQVEGGGSQFHGLIDDVRVYNRALSAAEISSLYNAGYAGDVLFNSDSRVLQYCDGHNWVGMGPVPGAGPQITDGMNATHVLGQSDFTSGGSATTQSGMTQPSSVAYDSANNRLFVADTNNNRVLEFDLSGGITDGMNATHVLGQSDFTSGGSATTRGGMKSPSGVFFDSANNRLFVADTNNNRVLEFDLSGGITDGMNATHVLGQSNFTSGSSATAKNRMSGPYGVFFDSANSRLFVGDSTNNRVLEFDLSGGITDGMNATHVLGQSNFTSGGSARTQSGMKSPRGVFFDSSNNRLFVVDEGNGRVLAFDLSGGITDGMTATHVLGEPDFTSGPISNGPAGMSAPYSVFFDSGNSLLFVADSGNGRVLEFDLSGGISDGMNATHELGEPDLMTYAPATTQAGMFLPTGVFFDSANSRLFVADPVNSRIVDFSFSCTGPSGSEGAMIYNSDNHVMQYCDGYIWEPMGPPLSSGGTGCSNPTGIGGQMKYNSDHHVVQYCNDTNWVPAGGGLAVAPSNGLVGWWKLDDESGSTAADSSGQGNNGTVIGSPSWTSGKIGGALSFNGTTNEVSTSDGNSVKGLTQVTVSAWLKPTAYNPNFAEIYFEPTTVNAGNTRLEILLTPTGGIQMGGRSPDAASYVTWVQTAAAIPLNAWTLVTAVYDSVSGNYSIYLNGVLSASSSSSGSAFTNSNPFATPFIGSEGDTDAYDFIGSIDDVRIYNRALSAAEVWDLYLGTGGT